MDNILGGLQNEKYLVYLDDIIIFSSSLEEHIQRLKLIFDRLRFTYLKLQPDKCVLLPEVTNATSDHNVIYLPSIDFDCCEESVAAHLEDIPYLKLQHLSLDNLNAAKYHLNDIKKTLDNTNKPFFHRHIYHGLHN